jgi:uncharacterized membrane protein
MDQSTIDEGKTMAIISYVTIIGLVVAYFSNKDKGNEFTKFHIGQSVRAIIAGIVISIIATILVMVTGIGLISYFSYAGLVFMVLGVLNAMNGKTEKLPLIGNIG